MLRNFKIIFFVVFLISNTTLVSQSSKKDYNGLVSFTNLDEALNSQSTVKKLILKRKRLNEFPNDIFKLKNLVYLDLSKNKIDSLPENMGDLKNLEVLILSKNKISQLPSSIFQLKKLKIFVLQSNDISYISKQISNMDSLEYLDLWNTNVSDLPYQLTELKNLKEIDLRGILLNQNQQEELLDMFEDIKLYLSPPCSCNF